jgi:hypothetical protein
MRDFYEKLGDQLEALGRAEEEQIRAAKRTRRARRRRMLVALPMAIAAVTVFLLLQGSGPEPAVASFPVLQRPIVDARRIPIAAELRRNGAQLTRARAFTTPVGRGYAFPRTTGGLCLAVPDSTGGYVEVCGTRAFVARHGLAVVAGRSTGGVPFALLLPRGASNPTASLRGGLSRKLRIDRGVVAGLLPAGATVHYRILGRAIQLRTLRSNPAAVPTVRACGNAQEPTLPKAQTGRTQCP